MGGGGDSSDEELQSRDTLEAEVDGDAHLEKVLLLDKRKVHPPVKVVSRGQFMKAQNMSSVRVLGEISPRKFGFVVKAPKQPPMAQSDPAASTIKAKDPSMEKGSRLRRRNSVAFLMFEKETGAKMLQDITALNAKAGNVYGEAMLGAEVRATLASRWEGLSLEERERFEKQAKTASAEAQPKKDGQKTLACLPILLLLSWFRF